MSVPDRFDQVYQNSIKLSACNVADIRGADCFRVLDSLHQQNLAISGAVRLLTERPDLERWIREAMDALIPDIVTEAFVALATDLYDSRPAWRKDDV